MPNINNLNDLCRICNIMEFFICSFLYYPKTDYNINKDKLKDSISLNKVENNEFYCTKINHPNWLFSLKNLLLHKPQSTTITESSLFLHTPKYRASQVPTKLASNRKWLDEKDNGILRTIQNISEAEENRQPLPLSCS